MTTEINIKDIAGNSVITFKNIQLNENNIIRKIYFNIKVKYNEFLLDVASDAEVSDFLYFVDGLKKIINKEIANSYFNHLDKRKGIKVFATENEIRVDFEYFDIDFNGKLSFDFNANLKEIPILIEEINSILSQK